MAWVVWLAKLPLLWLWYVVFVCIIYWYVCVCMYICMYVHVLMSSRLQPFFLTGKLSEIVNTTTCTQGCVRGVFVCGQCIHVQSVHLRCVLICYCSELLCVEFLLLAVEQQKHIMFHQACQIFSLYKTRHILETCDSHLSCVYARCMLSFVYDLCSV